MSEAKGSWEEDRIHLEAAEQEGPVPCWYFSTPDSHRKWRVVEYPGLYFHIKLGLVGPRWEEHGKRYWVHVWKSRTMADAKLFVERQEGPTPAVTGPARTEEGA